MASNKPKGSRHRRTDAEKVILIRGILYPGGDMEHQWTPDTIDQIAQVILDDDRKTGWTSWPPRRKRLRRSRSLKGRVARGPALTEPRKSSHRHPTGAGRRPAWTVRAVARKP